MEAYVQAGLSGVLTGGLYGLMAIGLSLSWGLLRLANIAHFAVITLAAYSTYVLSQEHGVDPLLTMLVTAPVMLTVAVIIQAVFNRYSLLHFPGMVATFGLYIAITGIIQRVWSADFRTIDSTHNPYRTQSWFLGDYAFRLPLVISFAVSVFAVVMLEAGLRRTRFGKAMRAIGHDKEIAGAFGISYGRLATVVAGIGGATAGVAGALAATTTSTVQPLMAYEWFGPVFVAVIIAGPGSVAAVFLAAVALTVVTNIASIAWDIGYVPLITFGLLLAILLVRPASLSRAQLE